MTRTLPKKIKAVYWNQEWAGNATSFEKTFDDLTTGDDGYNVIILAFWTHEDADMAKDWANVVKDDPDGAQRAKQVLINNNAFLFLSMGGATYLPIDGAKGCTFNYPSTADLVRFKNTLYDGVDYDMEHICRMDCTVKAGCNADCTKSPSDGPCITAMVKSMKGARDEGLFVAAAPQGPYFSDNQYSINYASPALLNVIDFYNIQFYNNDPGEGVAAGCSFSDNESWLMSDTASLNPWGAANVQWVIDAGVPASKIVIGKCNQGCPNGGYVGGGTLLNWIEKFNSTPGGASNKEEIRGIMVWELNNTKGVTSTTGDWEAGKDVDCGMACAGRGWLTDKTDNCEGKPVGALLPAAGQKDTHPTGYGQCGGSTHIGSDISCPPKFSCMVKSSYYSQCLPEEEGATSPPSTHEGETDGPGGGGGGGGETGDPSRQSKTISNNKKLSTGAIIGIVAGVVVGLALLTVILVKLFTKKVIVSI